MALICPVLLGPFSNWEWLGRKPLDEIRSNRFGAAPWEPTIDSCAVVLASKKGKKRKRKQETGRGLQLGQPQSAGGIHGWASSKSWNTTRC